VRVPLVASLVAHGGLLTGVWFAWQAGPPAAAPRMPLFVMHADVIADAIWELPPPAAPAPPAPVVEEHARAIDDDYVAEIEMEMEMEMEAIVAATTPRGSLTARVRPPRKPAPVVARPKPAVPSRKPDGATRKPQPVVKLCAAPSYPRRARDRGLEGRVVVRALVGTDGKVLETEIVTSSGHAILDRSAVRAVQRWIFKPALQDGKPIERWYRTALRFTLN